MNGTLEVGILEVNQECTVPFLINHSAKDTISILNLVGVKLLTLEKSNTSCHPTMPSKPGTADCNNLDQDYLPTAWDLSTASCPPLLKVPEP